MSRPFVIDTTKIFPTLTNPPVVECVVRWEIESAKEVERYELQQLVEKFFPECEIIDQFDKPFSLISRLRETTAESKFPWCGFIIKDKKRRLNIDWRPSGLMVSQSAPYEGWDKFSELAKTIWGEFRRIYDPSIIVGLGVRYLSSVTITQERGVAFYTNPPTNPFEDLGLDRSSYFAQDRVLIENVGYEVKLLRMLLDERTPPSLIVDIDVTRKKTTPISGLDSALAEMRFIKNKIFFTIFPKAETQFQ